MIFASFPSHTRQQSLFEKSSILWHLVFAGLYGIALYAVLFYTTQPMGYGDSGYYLNMAQNPGELIPSPWGYRILVPYGVAYLSKIFSLQLETIFRILSCVCFVVILQICFVWLHRFEKLPAISAYLVLSAFTFSFIGVYNIHNYIHIGLVEYLYILLGFLTIRFERFFLLMGILGIGSLVKETTIVLIPVYFAYNYSRRPLKRLLALTSFLALPVCIVFFLLRSGAFFTQGATFHEYSSFYSWEYVNGVYHYWGGAVKALFRVVRTFDIFWLFAGLGFHYTSTTHKKLSTLIPLSVSLIILATDIPRVVGLAFPAILFFSAQYFRRIHLLWQVVFVLIHIVFFYSYNYFFFHTWALAGAYCLTGICCAVIHVSSFKSLLTHSPFIQQQ